MGRLRRGKWILLVSLLAMMLFIVIGCSRDMENKSSYNISGMVLDGQGLGLEGVTLTISGSTNSQVTTDSNGQWTSTVNGSVVVRPLKKGYHFSPKEVSIQNQVTGIIFTLETIIREEGDPSITLSVEGLMVGAMNLYMVHVKEITGIAGATAYSLLSKETFQGIVKGWTESSYGASISQQLTLAVLDPTQGVLATVEVPYGTYTKTFDLLTNQKNIKLEAIEQNEGAGVLWTHDYLAHGYVENRIYDEEDIPLQLPGDGAFPPGYILINDIAVEFYYAFDESGHFDHLLDEKFEEVDYIFDDLHLYISLPDLETLIDAKTGEELSEEEKSEVLSGILLLYDHDHQEGTPLARANVSVEVSDVDPSTIYQVWVHSVHGVEDAQSFTILDHDNPATAFGEEITRTTLEDAMPVYILNRSPEEPCYVVSGTVVDEEGDGIPDVTISFSGDLSSVITQTDGTWVKTGLTGTVTVTPQVDGYSFDPSHEIVTEERDDVDFVRYLGFVEDFGDGLAPYWEFTGDADWVIDDSTYTEAGQSARSGSITHNQTTGMKIGIQVVEPGTISFDRKVSSENNFDYLRFYVDGQRIARWSGERDWERMTYDIDPGFREIEFRYTKDGSVSHGQDCAWIDNILITGTPPTPYAISGIVEDGSGNGMEGVTITFSDGYDSVTTSSDGTWSKEELWGTITVRPIKAGYIFTPSSRVVDGEDHFVDFTGEEGEAGDALGGLTASFVNGEVTIIVSNEGRTILNAFLIDDMDGYLPDGSMETGTAYWENQIHYLLPHDADPSILLHEESVINSYASDALDSMGLDYTHTTSHSNLLGYLTDGSHWDLLVLDSPNIPVDNTLLTAIEDYVEGGGSMVISTWWIHNRPSHSLWSVLSYSYDRTITSPQDIHQWVAHPIFLTPNEMPLFDNWNTSYGNNVFPGSFIEDMSQYVPQPVQRRRGDQFNNNL